MHHAVDGDRRDLRLSRPQSVPEVLVAGPHPLAMRVRPTPEQHRVVRSEVGHDHTVAVVRAIGRMRQDLSGPLSLSDLATTGSFSPYHFHRIFRSITATTPARFLAALRMAQARRLLLHTDLSVATIGNRVGYTSSGTFGTQFNRLVGTSPRRFRALALRLTDRPIRELPVTGRGASPPAWLLSVELRRSHDRADPPDGCGASLGPTVQLRGPTDPGEYEVRLVLVNPAATAAEAFVDHLPGSFLTGTARLRVDIRGRLLGQSDLYLRPSQPTDLPLLAATPLSWICDVATGRRDPTSHRRPGRAAPGGQRAATVHLPLGVPA
ncbi:AraC family transcriptional regulator [Micromonospora sp. NPDC049374]|uniref:AraC family transcriptional regulator n=1 Tax=Micromonospora sp. NPDC049374 TaxID=3154352 RepID=UPI003445D640